MQLVHTSCLSGRSHRVFLLAGLGAVLVILLLTLLIAPASAAVSFFSNNSGISIPSSGAATPYPSTINVSGVTGTVTHVNVGIVGLTHTFPDDINIIVSSPGGQGVMLMSDAGTSLDVNGGTLVFSDCALRVVPNTIRS